jgi:hypothetical protein
VDLAQRLAGNRSAARIHQRIGAIIVGAGIAAPGALQLQQAPGGDAPDQVFQHLALYSPVVITLISSSVATPVSPSIPASVLAAMPSGVQAGARVATGQRVKLCCAAVSPVSTASLHCTHRYAGKVCGIVEIVPRNGVETTVRITTASGITIECAPGEEDSAAKLLAILTKTSSSAKPAPKPAPKAAPGKSVRQQIGERHASAYRKRVGGNAKLKRWTARLCRCANS